MSLQGTTVAVTGATGFLGRYLVDALDHRGASVVGVVRNPERGRDLADRGIELRRADLADADALAEALDGADAVVSNAALVSLGGTSPDELIRTNVEGTANVFEAVGRAGVGRAVQISSCTAYRAPMLTLARAPRDERWPLRRAGEPVHRLNAYGTSKALSERRAWQAAEQLGVGLTTFRPSTVFGCGDPNFLPTLRRLLALPVCPFPVGARISLVYAGDVADAVVRALERPEASGRAYNVGGDDTTLWELTRIWRALDLGGPALQLPVPCPVTIPWSSERAERELGWTARSLADALRDTLERERAAGARST